LDKQIIRDIYSKITFQIKCRPKTAKTAQTPKNTPKKVPLKLRNGLFENRFFNSLKRKKEFDFFVSQKSFTF